MTMPVATCVDFFFNSKPGDLWVITAACREHEHLEGVRFRREVGDIHPCLNGCVYERYIGSAVTPADGKAKPLSGEEVRAWADTIKTHALVWIDAARTDDAALADVRAEAIAFSERVVATIDALRDRVRELEAVHADDPTGEHADNMRIARDILDVATDEDVLAVLRGQDGESLTRQFHELYEELAPQFSYTTREDTRTFHPSSPNGRLMAAVCERLFARRARLLTDAEVEELATRVMCARGTYAHLSSTPQMYVRAIRDFLKERQP